MHTTVPQGDDEDTIVFTPTDFARAVEEFHARSWSLFVVTGLLWLLLGFIVLSARPGSIAIAVVFVAFAFAMGAVSQFALARVADGGWRSLARAGGALSVLAAFVTLVWPGPTLLVASLFIAWYLLVRGISDIVAALSRTHVGRWWLRLVSGLFEIGLGAWAIGNPDRSVLLLVSIVGVWCIVEGSLELMVGMSYRDAARQAATGSAERR